jgi:nitrate/nitrite transport system ATP-binding protein
MKQRVGIARALAMEPKVLLMDEPFGALILEMRAGQGVQRSEGLVHEEHLGLHGQRPGDAVIMITHDVDEAVLLSDRIVMMTNGPSATIGEVLSVPLGHARQAAIAGLAWRA